MHATQSIRFFLRAPALAALLTWQCASATDTLPAKSPAATAVPAASGQASTTSGPQTLPAFSLPDLAGKSHTPAEWKGKVVIVDFWATWCASCRTTIASLGTLHRKDADKGLQIVGISLDKGPLDKVIKFSRKLKMDYLLLRDTTDAQSNLFGFEGIPSLYLYGKDGALIKGLPNYTALEDKDLEAIVDKALAATP